MPSFTRKAIVPFIETHASGILVGITLIALLLSIAFLIEQPPTMDLGETGHWWPIIQNLIQGKGYAMCEPEYFPYCTPHNDLTASREPVPVLIFAIVALFTNQSLLAASVVEVGIYLAVLFLTFFLTRLLANTRAALLAALLWVVFIPSLELLPQVSGEAPACLFLTLGIFFILRGRETNRWRDWLLAGISMGLGVLSRSALIFILAGLLFGLLWEGWVARRKQRDEFIKRLWASLSILLIALSMLTPWVVRNIRVFNSPVIGTTLSGYNLYRHNYMLGSDNFSRYIAGEEAHQAIQDLLARQPALLGTENEAQMDRVYIGAALKVITAHPLRYIALSLWRFLPLWFDWQIDEAYGTRTPHLDYYEMAVQGLFLVTALIAIRKNWQHSWPLWSSIAIYCLSYMAVVGQLRYLIVVTPLTISLSAIGCWQVLDASFTKKAVGNY